MRVKAAIGPVTIFLVTIFIVSALPSTISGFRFSTTYGQMSPKAPGVMEPAEGYRLSKYSDYSSFDREYTRNDTLYVWAWSYRIDPYHLMQHPYCQLLKLGEYEYNYTFPISYHPNMTRYSYVGSFELSTLEKTGDWKVQIFLKSKLKPPPESYEPEDVIHVSDVPPPSVTYTLSVSSTPIADISFTLDDQQYTTHWSGPLTEGTHTIRMPSSVIVGNDTYNFDRWSDGDPNPKKTVDLQADTSLVATYKLLTPPPAPPNVWQVAMPYIVPMGLLALFGVTAYTIVRGRRRRIREEVKETEYRITLEDARLEAALQELDNLLEKGIISRERYEVMRREIEDELTRIRGLKS